MCSSSTDLIRLRKSNCCNDTETQLLLSQCNTMYNHMTLELHGLASQPGGLPGGLAGEVTTPIRRQEVCNISTLRQSLYLLCSVTSSLDYNKSKSVWEESFLNYNECVVSVYLRVANSAAPFYPW